MPIAKRKKRITDPTPDPDLAIEEPLDVSLIEEIVFKHGAGQGYDKPTWKFLNNDTVHPTSRKVKVKRVYHRAVNAQGGPPTDPGDQDDITQYIDYELIQECTVAFGRGFVRDRIVLVFDETHPRYEQAGAGVSKSHVKRIVGRGNNWIDIERTDELVVKFASKDKYQKYFFVVPWLEINPATGNTYEEDFDNYPSPLGALYTGPDPDDPNVGFDPPWRFDPFQNPVNVMWSRSGEPGPAPDIYAGGSIVLIWSSFNSIADVFCLAPSGAAASVIGNFNIPNIIYSGRPSFSESVPFAPSTPRPLTLVLDGSGGSSVTFHVEDGDNGVISGPHTLDFGGVSADAGINHWSGPSISNVVLNDPTGDALSASQTITMKFTFTNGTRG